MRKYLRAKAHYKMKVAGLHKVNRNGFFAKNWRKYSI